MHNSHSVFLRLNKWKVELKRLCMINGKIEIKT